MVFQNFRIVTTQENRESSSFPEFSLTDGWLDIADKEWRFLLKRTQNYLDKIAWLPSPNMAPPTVSVQRIHAWLAGSWFGYEREVQLGLHCRWKFILVRFQGRLKFLLKSFVVSTPRHKQEFVGDELTYLDSLTSPLLGPRKVLSTFMPGIMAPLVCSIVKKATINFN